MYKETIGSSVREKVVFIEMLRVVACFLVIVNHTNSRIFLGSTVSFLWLISLIYFFVCKIAVPIFIMITGYVMLERQDSYKKTLIRIWHIGLCLVLFSGFYYVSGYISGTIECLSLKHFIVKIISAPITNAFWYLYLYLGVLLMLPFVQKMVCNMQKRDFHVFFLVSGLFYGTWPILVHYISSLRYSEHFVLPLFNSYICMLLLGCYVKRYCMPSRKVTFVCGILFCFMCAVNISLTYREYVKNEGSNYLFFDNITFLPIVVASFCLFYIVSTIRFSDRVKRWGVKLGDLTFGIFLFSDFFIEKFAFIYNVLIAHNIYPMIAVLVFEVTVFVAGSFVTYMLKKIPLFKQIL